jgi:uncharacterized protein YjdB
MRALLPPRVFPFALLVAVACSGGGDAPTLPGPGAVRAVTVTPGTAAIRVGESQPLNAVVNAAAGAATGVTWSSANTGVATVSATGVVTAVSVGTATIKATAVADAKVAGSATITVAATRSLTLTPATVTIGGGQTATLTATVDGGTGFPATVTWRSSATNIASVSTSGVVSGVAPGVAIITALSTADTTLRASTTVTVNPAIRTIAVAPTAASIFINGTQQLTSTVTADAGVEQTVAWRSTNPAIASVNAAGLVTGVAFGSTTISAIATADTTRRATMTVTVTPRPISVAIAQRNVALHAGSSLPLTGLVTADPGVNTGVVWSSSAPAVVAVSASGVLTTSATSGTAVITAAAAADASKTDRITVTVTTPLPTSWSASRLNGNLVGDIISVIPFDASTAFAVDSVGDVYRWSGTTWTLSAAGRSYNTRFTSVAGSAADQLIAVGTSGVIARFNGTTWSAVPSGTSRDLLAVVSESATSAYAVGVSGTIVRWNGSVWSVETSGSTQRLHAVWAGSGVAYAVGAAGEVLRRSGTPATWSRVTAPTPEPLYGVHGLSATDVVAVGGQGTILRFNGAAWSVTSAGGFSGDLYAVSGSTANGGRRILVGSSGAAQLDGGVVTLVSTPYAPALYAVGLEPSGTPWVAGQRGAVMRGGASWTTLNLAPDLVDVWSASATSALAVGEFGFVYRWNGSAWSRVSAPTTTTLKAVWMADATSAFLGGDAGTLLRWDGTSLSSMTVPTTSDILAVWGTSRTNVYATTRAGELLRFTGTSWTVQSTAPSALWALTGTGATNVYMAGENGFVQQLDGTMMTAWPSAGTGTLTGLWMLGATAGYAVGASPDGLQGAAYRFASGTWSPISTGSTPVLTSLWGPSLFDLFATGDRGTLLHFNGTSWRTIPTGTTDLLWAMSAPATGGAFGAFAVGYNSRVVTAGGTPALSALQDERVPESTSRLEPAVGARRTRGPMPIGAARRRR